MTDTLLENTDDDPTTVKYTTVGLFKVSFNIFPWGQVPQPHVRPSINYIAPSHPLLRLQDKAVRISHLKIINNS